MNILSLKSITRKQFLKWLSWLGLGWMAAVLNQRTFKEPASGLMILETWEFEVISLNGRGKVLKKEPEKSQYFTEFLGKELNLEMVYIPGGSFLMGTEEDEIERLVKKFNWKYFRSEKPQHEVTVQSFFIGKYPVTQEQWREIAFLPKVNRDIEVEPSYFKSDKRPVEKVAWDDAVEFCARLSKYTKKEYRLPSEAEWEYAARAGTTTPFYCGETITGKLADYRASNTYANEPKGEYRGKTTAVGSFPANAFGLYDMHGNVLEWSNDDWHDSYQEAPTDGRAWIYDGSSLKVVRGGSWLNAPCDCRSAYRFDLSSYYQSYFIGFRVVCVVSWFSTKWL